MDNARFRLVHLAHNSHPCRLAETEPVQVAKSGTVRMRIGAKAQLELRKRAASTTFDKESRK